MAAPGPDLRSAYYFSYEVISRDYTAAERAAVPPGTFGPGANRKVAIENLQKGAVMFHYFKVPKRNLGEADADYAKRTLDNLFGHFGVPITWNSGLQRWEFCFGSVVPNYHYYYPNPCAGFGVDGFGQEFNAAFICTTTRRSKWLYAKSGTHIPNALGVHRRYPLNDGKPNYDYLRLKKCNEIPLEGTCRPGNEYDLCMTKAFQTEKRIDGVTSIAQADDLMDVIKQHGAYQYQTDKSMFNAMREWRHLIQVHHHNEIDYALWTMNLLCLETDLKGQRLNFGFREFSCSPFGANQPDLIPNQFLPLDPFGVYGVNYGAFDEQYNHGVCIRRRFWVRDAIVAQFFRSYIFDNLLFRPIGLITNTHTYSFDGVEEHPEVVIPEMPGPPGVIHMINVQNLNHRARLRYNMNHFIGQFFNDHYHMNDDANIGGILFDVLHNVFYIDNPRLDKNVNVRYDANLDSGYPFEAPLNVAPHQKVGYPIRFYKIPFRINRLDYLQNYKIVKELFTNKGWERCWMSELAIHFMDAQQYVVCLGPFYNPLSIPITNFHEMLQVYHEMLHRLEADKEQHSYSLQIFNDGVYRQFLTNLLAANINHRYEYAGNEYPYLVGVWFRDIYAFDPVARPIQTGGGIKKTPSKKFSESFKSNFKKNFKNYYTNLNKRSTRKNNKKLQISSKDEIQISSKDEINDSREGHTSENIVEITSDEEYILSYIQKDKILGELWKLMFDDNKSNEQINISPVPTKFNKTVSKRRPKKLRTKTRRKISIV